MDPLPLDVLTRLDEMAEQFEDSLYGRSPMRLEEVLKSWPEKNQSVVFRHLLAVELGSRSKRAFLPVREEYRTRFPESRDIVDATFAELHLPDQVVIGPYRLLAELGSGGMGVVYRAIHTRLNRTVALKLLRTDSPSRHEDEARFDREMRALGAVSHVNLVQACDAGEFHGVRFLAMELLNGVDVQQLITERGRLPLAAACEIIRQTATGLSHAHAQGLVHRDIKPANLWLTTCGTVKILDLGLALFAEAQCLTDTSITQLGQVVGTIDYQSPEQAKNAKAADGRSDIFSLGATFYRLLAGSTHLTTDGSRSTAEKLALLVADEYPRLADRRMTLPVEIVELVDRMMNRDPEKRVQTAAEVAEFLIPWSARSSLIDMATMPGLDAGETQARCDPTTRTHIDPVVQPAPVRHLVPQPAADNRNLSYSPHAERKSRRIPTWIGVVSLAIAIVVAVVIVLIRTDGGEIVIHCADPSLQIEILRNNAFVASINVGQLADPTWVQSGHYEIRIPREGKDRVTIVDGRFQLRRGKKHLVTIRLEHGPDSPTAQRIAGECSKTKNRSPDKGMQASGPMIKFDASNPLPPIGIVPFGVEDARQLQLATAEFLGIPVETENTLGMQFVVIPGGQFRMGCPPEYVNASLATAPAEDPLYAFDRRIRVSESPQHDVKISHPYLMGISEVTQAQFVHVMGFNPATFSADGRNKDSSIVKNADTSRLPVEGVSWLHAIQFCNELSRREHRAPCYATVSEDAVPDLTADGYRLPTEAEFEFAARAGTDSLFFFGNDTSKPQLDRYCWWSGNCNPGPGPTPSGRFPANAFGLQGVHGNTFEWVQDWYSDDFYSHSPDADPTGPAHGVDKVLRGGGWHAPNWAAMASHSRWALRPHHGQMWCGLRVVLNVPRR